MLRLIPNLISFLNLDPNFATFYQNITFVKELDFETIRCINFYACLSTFTYQRLSNNSINYYVNHADGFSIYDQDWDLV